MVTSESSSQSFDNPIFGGPESASFEGPVSNPTQAWTQYVFAFFSRLPACADVEAAADLFVSDGP